MATGGLHEHTSDEIFDFTCSPCAEQNRNKEAIRYCVECQDYYCQSCTDMHKMFPAMRGHKLLKTDFSASNQQPGLKLLPTERCSVHKTKLIDMYCRIHDAVCCTSCVVENHRSCNSVTSITDVIKERGAIEGEEDTLIQELSSLINVCLQIKRANDKDMSEMNSAKERADNEIKHIRKELETVLEQLENTSRKKVENYHKMLSNESAKVKQNATELENRLKERIAALRLSTSNVAQTFVSGKLGQKDLAEISEVANTILKDKKTVFEYVTDYPSVRQSLSEIMGWGDVKRQAKFLFGPVDALYEVNGMKALNVNTLNDRVVCKITSSCFDDRGFLLLTDNNNTSLKRVNIQTQSVIDKCLMRSQPFAVCCVNKEEAAVSLNNKSIQFVLIRDQLKITRQVPLDHVCCGLVCSDGKMYVSDGDKKLYIHDLSGNLIKIIPVPEHNSLRHVAYDRYHDKMYATDINEGLVSFDKQGENISSITNRMLVSAQGACSDGRGSMFVGGWGSGTVIQISADGQILGEVIGKSFKLGNIWSVCFDEIQKRLVATVTKNNQIYVFDLSLAQELDHVSQ